MPQRKIYALTLKKVCSYACARGVELSDLLAGTELYPSDLEDPYRLVSEEQARRFYRNALDLSGEDSIGLEVGWTMTLAELGPLGLMQIVARTVREAVEHSAKTYHTHYPLVDYKYQDDGDTRVFRLTCREEYEPLRIFLLERVMSLFQANCEELVDSDARPTKILVDYKAPPYIGRYKEIFRCPVYFEKETVEMHYPRAYLDREMESYDPQALEVLKVLQSSLIGKLTAEKDVVNEVKMALRRNPGEYPRLEQVADRLAMSPRTLRRKLGAANLRFQDLLDAERRKVAEDFLANSDLTVQQIAEQCGFKDAQNFSQAFKRWSGISPTEYRSTHRS